MDMLGCRPGGSGTLRAEIQLSWRRVSMGGLRPDIPIDRLAVTEIDTSSRLMVAARPVLEEMAEQLAGTRFSVILADRECRIVDRWFDTAQIEKALEEISAVPGSQFAEDTIGTNGLGTPVELRRGVVVHGGEHFIDSLKRFSCYGHPIRHPATQRIEGVLDITGITKDANPMLAPFLVRAVRDIEQRLLDGSRMSQRRLIAAFQEAIRRRSRAVAVLGDDAVLTNKAAVDLLGASDHATLRALAEDASRHGSWSQQLRLGSGALVDLRAKRIPGTEGGTLFHLDPIDRSHVPVPRGAMEGEARGARERVLGLREATGPILIAGEPGTGRTSAIRTIADKSEVSLLHAADVAFLGEHGWADRLRHFGQDPHRLLAIEDLHLLPGAMCALVARLIAEGCAARIVLTSAPIDQLPSFAASVATSCPSRLELPPLRNRIDELPELIRALLAEINPGCALRFTPSALAALAAQPWLGNLRELSVVLRGIAERRSAGDVTPADLPTEYRGTPRAARLAGRERAERAAIIEALTGTSGNKARAAHRLGISRTTLYSRMKALGVTL